MKNKIALKKLRISFALNIFIVLFTIIASLMMFLGIRFTDDIILETSNIEMFKFFTVDSNIFMGIVSLIFLYYENKILKNKSNNIPKKIYLLKLMGTVSVMLTFLVVFLYLGHIAKGGLITMLYNSNLFFHLLTPLLSFITFVFYEKTNCLSLKDTFLGLVPMIMYAIFYIINIIIHVENGKVSPMYDWYWFVQGGIWSVFIVVPLIFLLTYMTSLITWKLNKFKV